MNIQPENISHKKILSFPIYKGLEKEGHLVHDTLDELVTVLSSFMEKYNYTNIYSLYFRLEREEQKKLYSINRRFVKASMDFVHTRDQKNGHSDEKKRVKLLNALLSDFADTYRKNNISPDILYEIIRSLKYFSYYEELGYLFNEISNTQKQILERTNNAAVITNMDSGTERLLKKTEMLKTILTRRCFTDPYDLLQSRISEFPHVQQFNILIQYLYQKNHLMRYRPTDEDYMENLESIVSHPDISDSDIASVLMADYMYNDQLNTQVPKNYVPPLEGSYETFYSESSIDTYNTSIKNKVQKPLLDILIRTNATTAFGERSAHLTFTSVFNKTLCRNILPLSKDQLKNDEAHRVLTEKNTLLTELGYNDTFLLNIELIKNPNNEICLATAPLFPLKLAFESIGLHSVYEVLEYQVNEAHKQLHEIAEKEQKIISKEIETPMQTLRAKIRSLIESPQTDGTVTSKEYLDGLSQLGFYIEQANGSHKKASHASMPKRPLTIKHNEDFKFNVIRQNFEERDIPVEYFLGVIRGIFSAKEKKILQMLPPISDFLE